MLPLIVFLLFPVAEIAVFIAASHAIGFGWAFLCLVFAALLGGFLVHGQGIATVLRSHEAIWKGKPPEEELFNGLCFAVAGILLICPGFVTDAIALVLLLPPVRAILLQRLTENGFVTAGGFNADFSQFHNAKTRHRPDVPDVIDVEYETLSVRESSEKTP